MKKVYFLTTNKKKVEAANRVMNPLGVSVEGIHLEMAEGRSDEPAEIAKEKLEQAKHKVSEPLIVEDSGYFIRALKGFPKTQVHFMLTTIGVSGIIKLMEDVEDRHCEFRYGLGFCDPVSTIAKVFEFIEPGAIAREVREGTRECWTDLWKIHIPIKISSTKTLSELTPEEVSQHHEWFDTHSHWYQFAEWYSTL